MSASEAAEFQSARRYISISQITAIISLFFGGILLSSVAVVCAFIARGKLDNIAAARTGEPDVQQALKRSGLIVVAVAALALVLNIAAVIYLYPFVMDAMQSGDLASLVGGSASSAAGAGSSTWG